MFMEMDPAVARKLSEDHTNPLGLSGPCGFILCHLLYQIKKPVVISNAEAATIQFCE